MDLHHDDNIITRLRVSLPLIIQEARRMFLLLWPSCRLCKMFTNVVLLRQKADKVLRRMETTVGEPTDSNGVRIFMFEKQSRGGKVCGRLFIFEIIYTLADTLESLI